MTNGQAAAIGERVAVLEHKIDAALDAMHSNAAKLDLLIEGQGEGKRDRSELRDMIVKMQPDVETITDIKRAGKFGAWVIGGIGSIVVVLISAKGWIVLNFNWLFSR